MRPITLGVCAAFFFAFTFIFNRMMDLSGGSWIWSASLRYFFMVPMLLIIVLFKKSLVPLFDEMKKRPLSWVLWSTIGFGLFYAPICFAAAYGPGWLIAGTWQITIISGSLLVPLFYETIQTVNGPARIRGRIPYKGLAMSLVILFGVALMQYEQASELSIRYAILCVVPIIIASFAYPLGNRKMMEICAGRLDAWQRVLGMTIASLPFWLILSCYSFITVGMPAKEQIWQSAGVALFAGVFATVLFFAATDLVKGNMRKLGAVESTQSLEVLFAATGEILLLSTIWPSFMSWMGMGLVIVGMVLHSYVSTRTENTVLQAVNKEKFTG
ncbi:multidrug resistance efflux transporter family protein [Peribacillus cavernae]|uniref:Multidrug resistance efflux transporter family protein n=1 Tax=Peribacillus cavernae TaxID=1674310 RepID=A0A433HRX9_9BACI|nr:multidrug resistance efflux transporter family protein [Peribacillus cavernae]MDQ0218830.1 hypothetical protein [Peribacillus cavernae]RUQ31035.1 multidrug resistance efflux transporter family protein [Peribacillus cavernae]